MLALALALVEAGLTLLPYAWARLQWTPPPDGAQTWLIFAGDSVTAGFGLPDKALAYPGVIQGDLRAHGETDYGVFSVARSASDVAAMGRQVQDALNVTPNAVHPVVLAMVGHNDLMSWSKGPLASVESGGERQGPQNSGSGPRLLRLLRWFGSAWHNDVPHANVLADWETDFGEALKRVQKRASLAGGELILLTYLVPGDPDEVAGLAPKVKVQLEATRRAQLDVNAAIRRAARALGTALIDVGAASGDAPYDPNLFLDNIHLTALGHRQVGELVRDQLALSGILPAELFKAPLAGGR